MIPDLVISSSWGVEDGEVWRLGNKRKVRKRTAQRARMRERIIRVGGTRGPRSTASPQRDSRNEAESQAAPADVLVIGPVTS